MRLVGGDIHGRLPISLGHLGWSMLFFVFYSFNALSIFLVDMIKIPCLYTVICWSCEHPP